MLQHKILWAYGCERRFIYFCLKTLHFGPAGVLNGSAAIYELGGRGLIPGQDTSPAGSIPNKGFEGGS